jgi:HK97 family phage prohead protease
MGSPDIDVKDGRTVCGILVPWDTPTVINDRLTEGFRSGAFDRQMERPYRVPFALGHMGANGELGGHAVGRLTMIRNDAAGLYGEAYVSETERGDEVLTLLRDGVYGSLSIGFRDMAPQAPDKDGVTWRTSAQLIELAVVLTPAYEDAFVTEIRQAPCMHCAGTGSITEAELLRSVQNAQLAEILGSLPKLDKAS